MAYLCLLCPQTYLSPYILVSLLTFELDGNQNLCSNLCNSVSVCHRITPTLLDKTLTVLPFQWYQAHPSVSNYVGAAMLLIWKKNLNMGAFIKRLSCSSVKGQVLCWWMSCSPGSSLVLLVGSGHQTHYKLFLKLLSEINLLHNVSALMLPWFG